MYFSARGGFVPTPVLASRAALTGAPHPGPLLVEEYDATTVVPSGWRASLAAGGSILLERGA